MCQLDESKIKEIYPDIRAVFETESVTTANALLSQGARLLCISKNHPESERAAVYILGWPESNGEVPLSIQRYGI